MAFAFEKLLVYQKAVAFADAVCTLTRGFPRGYFFLADQLNRAALSIAANIAGRPSRHPSHAVVQYHNAYLPGSAFALRRGRWKYALYEINGGWRAQLFDLQADPDEIDDLADRQCDQAAELDAALRRQIDVDAVVTEKRAWDRRMFRTWRGSLSRAAYERHLQEIYGAWGTPLTADHVARLEASMDA